MSKRITPINYTSREFNSIKQDLIEYAKRYYADTFRDFNEASFGSLMLDTVAYVGDILSFYMDYQVNESFLETAIQYNNVVKIGRQLGYKFPGMGTTHGIIAAYVVVPAAATGLGPDSNYLPILRRGSTFSSAGGSKFILNQNIDFSDSNNEVVVADVNQSTGIPSTYAIRAYGQVISGENVITTIDIGDFKKFRRVEIPGNNISEILSVTDSEGHTYYEVDYLSQNTVYLEVLNQGSDRENVKTILKPIIVPRRFTVERELGRTFLQFGYGSENNLRDNLITDPANLALDVHGKSYITDTAFDPARLTKTDKFGVTPVNTTLTVRYRVNRTTRVNAAVGTVTTVNSADFIFPSIQSGATLTTANINTVKNSIEVTNQDPIVGSVSAPTVEELKNRIYGHFAAQNRAVTREDYVSLIYSMPAKLGAIKRANVVTDADSFKRNLNVYVISEDSNGRYVKTNSTIKSNLKNYIKRYKMMNDSIDILDAFILNVGVEYTIVAPVGVNKHDILQRANATLKARVADVKREIGERFYITDIYAALRTVPGILDVVDVRITRKVGGRYSNTTLFVDELIDPDGRYFDLPENVILEIKFPNADIKGTVV